jgi:hypothetical protein
MLFASGEFAIWKILLRRYRRHAVVLADGFPTLHQDPEAAVPPVTRARIPVRPQRHVGYASGNKACMTSRANEMGDEPNWLAFDGSEDASAHPICRHFEKMGARRRPINTMGG